MPRSEKQKLKLLILLRFLYRQTDEQHPAAMSQLLAELAACGVHAERKSVYADLSCLQDFGFEILHDRRGYWLDARTFELPELKLLVDAVQASRFISENKTRSLIRKLQTLCSRHEAQSLQRQVVISGRAKSASESIYYNVDLIQNAIAADRRIAFCYFDWNLDGTRRFRDSVYEAAPCALCWDNEFYYLIAETTRHGITHYRVDKMTQVSLLEQPRALSAQAKALDLASYTKRTFGMFTGVPQMVQLRMENTLAGVVIDRFGADTMLIPDGPAHFCFTIEAAVSPLFLSWIMMFGSRAEILSPLPVRDAFAALCREALSAYETPAAKGLDNSTNSYYNDSTNSY